MQRTKILTIGKTILIGILVIGALYFSGGISSNTLYTEYRNLWDYRRLHPELLPDARTVKIISIGHEVTYADFSWIKLIQFIGDNIGNGKFLDFTHTILSNITEINPYFTRAYEMDLLMAPLIYPDSEKEVIEKYENIMKNILAHGEQSMQVLCDTEKIKSIEQQDQGTELWNNQELKNPCASGMIPYYMGYHYSNVFRDGKKSEYYYKIAGMHDDAPKISQTLSILAKSQAGNSLDGAMAFLLVAINGYDIEPFNCHKTADDLARKLLQKHPVTHEWIGQIERIESRLQNTKDEKHPESYGVSNCFDNTESAIKQIYIHYLTSIASEYPEVTDIQTLIETGVISHIPTIQSQKGYLFKKVQGRWKYVKNFQNL